MDLTKAEDRDDWKPRRMSFQEARLEQLRDWQHSTIEERLAAGWRLTQQAYAWRGVDLDQSETDFTLSRVTRPKR